MNSEIEQRIVAMYFDNKDFEKNAKQTIDTLGELKDSLDLKNSVKGFDELDKAGKKLNLNQARTTIKNMKESLSGMEGALKKAFDIGTAPLHALDNFFGTFRSYVGKFLGFDLASKFVNSLESAIRQLTVAPVEAGWNMYQQNIDSTKTIMSGTLKSYKEQMAKTSTDWTYNEDEHMAYVKSQLDELSKYAQQTVFSLSDMTANVGKFTNNNIDLETSVSAMEGIANMTAKAGQGAQQASMAMYNFSQALGVGKMTTIDWKSIENANLATTELKQLFIDTATAGGKLKKEVTQMADGSEIEKFFITVDKNGKQLARKNWIEISAENFRDSLSNGWLDKETMLRVFQLYSNQVKDLDTLKAWGFDVNDTQLVEYLFSIGEEAEAAATQVRTFSKMWDALRESVQSGWADSMQLVFGDMKEATAFWTEINNRIGEVFDNASKSRNSVLKEWRGLSFDEEAKEWKKLDGAVDGREDLIQGIYGTIDALKEIGAAFRNVWTNVFGEISGKKLQEITAGFRSLVERFREWLGSTNDENSRLSKLMTGVRGLLNVVKLVGNAIKTLINIGIKIVKPFVDPLIAVFEHIGKFLDLGTAKDLGEMIKTLASRFSDLFKGLKDLGFSGIMIKIGDTLKNIGVKIRDGLHEFLDSTGLGDVYNWFVQLGDNMKAGYEKVKSWWESSGIPQFFIGIWESITKLFTPTLESSYGPKGLESHYSDSPIVKFFKDTWEGLKSALEEVKSWGIWGSIGSFFTGVWKTISGIFQPTIEASYGPNGLESHYADSPFVKFFKDTWEKIKGVIEDVKSWEIWKTIGGFFSGVWKTIAGIFHPTIEASYGPNGLESHYADSPLVKFIKDTWETIRDTFEEIKGWGIWGTIGSFFSGVWETISGIFKPTIEASYGPKGLESHYADSPFVKFFKDTWEGIKETIEKIKGWSIWGTIGDFFSGVWDTIAGVFTPVTITGKQGNTWTKEAPIAKFFREAWESVKSVYEDVISWEIWGQIKDFFSDVFSSVVSFFEGFGQTGEAVSEASDTINEISNQTAPTEDSVSVFQRIIDAISGFFTTIMDKVAGVTIPPEVNKFFVNLGDLLKTVIGVIGDMMGNLSKVLKGEAHEFSEWGPIVGIILGVLVDKVFTIFNNRYLSKINGESFASKFVSLGIGIFAISSAIALLTTIDQTKMMTAVGAVATIGAVMAAIVGLLTKLTESRTDMTAALGKPQTPLERIATNLIGAIEKVGMVAVAMALLPNIIKAFADAKKLVPELNGSDIFMTLAGLATAIVGISLGLGLINKLTGEKGISPVAALKTAISVVGFVTVILGAILGIGAALDGIFGTENVVSSIEHGADILTALGGAISGLIGGFIGGFAKGFNTILDGRSEEEKINDSVAILESLGDKLEMFTADKTTGITRILNLIGLLSQTMDDVPKASDFTQFTNSLEPLATSVMKFGLILSGFMIDENQDKIPFESLKERILGLVEVMRAFDIPDFSTIVSAFKNKADYFVQGIDILSEKMTPERFKALGSFMANLVTAFNEAMAPEGEAMKTMSGDLMKNLSAAIKIGLGDSGKYEVGVFDAMPIIDSITTALGYGETAIAEAVHNMVQAGIDAGAEKGIQLPNSGLTGGTGDTNFVETLLQSTLGTGENGAEDITDQFMSLIYGEGGTSENPAEGSLFNMLNSVNSDLENFEFIDMSGKFDDIFKFEDAEGNAVDPTAKIKEMLGGLQEQVDALPSLEITIVPTFDFKNLNAAALQAALKDYPVGMPLDLNIPEVMKVGVTGMNANIDVEGIKARIDNVAAAVTEGQRNIVVAIQSMETRLDRVSNSIYNLKLYLDTGALVGGITPALDRELGKRAALSEVTGVSPTIAGTYYKAITQE